MPPLSRGRYHSTLYKTPSCTTSQLKMKWSDLDKSKAGSAGQNKSGLGRLEGLRNNAHPQWWRDPGLRKLTICERPRRPR